MTLVGAGLLVAATHTGLVAFLACAFATGALDRTEVPELLPSTPLAPCLAAVERQLATDGGYDEATVVLLPGYTLVAVLRPERMPHENVER